MNFKQTRKLVHAARREMDSAALRQALKDNHQTRVEQQAAPQSSSWKHFFRVTAWILAVPGALATVITLVSFFADFNSCVAVEAVSELDPHLPATSALRGKTPLDPPSVTLSVTNQKNYTLRNVFASCVNTEVTYGDRDAVQRLTQTDGKELDPAKVTTGDSQEFPSLQPRESIQFQCTTQILDAQGHPESPRIMPDSAEIKIAVDYKLFWFFHGRDRFAFTMHKSPNGERKFIQVPLAAPTGDA